MGEKGQASTMKINRVVRAIAVSLLASASALAQFDTSEVLGTLKDASGAGLSGASVTLLNENTGITAKATSDADGNYDFFNVKVGRYTVSALATGFDKTSTTGVDVAGGYTWTVTPSALLEARFAFNHIVAGKVPAIIGGASIFELYGIPGLPTSPNLVGGLNSQNISGFNQLRRQTSNPQFQNPTTFDPKFNFSWNKGRHAIKIGYEFQAIRTEIVDTIRSTAPTPMRATSASQPAHSWVRRRAAPSQAIRPATIWRISILALPARLRLAATRWSMPVSVSTRSMPRTITMSPQN